MVTLLEVLKNSGALEFGEFTLTSGRKSHYYIDAKKALTRPDVLRRIAKSMLPHVRGYSRIAGVELGAIPLVVALALETSLPYIMIRKGVRAHGTQKVLEGDLEPGDRVALIEDVTTTGGSVEKAVHTLREAGAVVDRVICIADRGEGAQDLLDGLGVQLIPLVSGEDLKAVSQ